MGLKLSGETPTPTPLRQKRPEKKEVDSNADNIKFNVIIVGARDVRDNARRWAPLPIVLSTLRFLFLLSFFITLVHLYMFWMALHHVSAAGAHVSAAGDSLA
eukprot:GHVU01156963.1.p1 GENE.GHVU01156963.1~~GHVU01156963.1.p1  ORF type:complete len:102 (-),score=8.66 GHVU01156963.1:578-883(-)